MVINSTLWTVGCLSAFTDEDLWQVNASDGEIINPVYTDYRCFSNSHASPSTDLCVLKPKALIWYHWGITVDITLIMCGGGPFFFFLILFNCALAEIRRVAKSLIPLFLSVDVINYPSIQTCSALTAACRRLRNADGPMNARLRQMNTN